MANAGRKGDEGLTKSGDDSVSIKNGQFESGEMDVAAVILAGGRGRRMGGRNKALLTYGNEPFIRRQCRLALEWAKEAIVVAPPSEELLQAVCGLGRVRVVPDEWTGLGPLAGLHAGLKASSSPVVWALACDQPSPSPEAARLLGEKLAAGTHRAAVPIVGGRTQPLHALYRADLASVCGALLAAGERRLGALLEAIAWTGVPEEAFIRAGIGLGFATDVDTPEEYRRLLKDAEGPDD